MTPDRWRRVQEIFTAATESEPESWQAFLEEACRDDPALRKEVESLIRSLERASTGFLESPVAGVLPKLVEEPSLAPRALEAGRRLGSYEILAPIGAGGMGEVYRARDLKLDRDVAMKVLPEDVAADPAARARFEREAKIVAEISHPNILSIFDFGTQDGMAFAVTELLEGETMRSRLERGPLTQEQVLSCALQIARGLSAAHERGIVHRDLKPENVFVTADEHVKILDFGLSKHVDDAAREVEAGVPAAFGLTGAGRVMGTVGYMSPEQASGAPVDARSDIFSFGAILYEMLSGRRAFRRDTPAETISAILEEEPRELGRSGHHIPEALDRMVRCCLEKDRDRRFASARDVVHALSRATDATASAASSPPRRAGRALAAASLIGAFVVVGVFSVRHTHGSTSEGVRRLAVLPFQSLGAQEDGYFADGVSNAVRGKLATLPGIQVIAGGSSTLYKKATKVPSQIARELDVKYLLTGTVRSRKGPAGESIVEVTPALLEIADSGTAAVKWQQPFEAPLTDVFRVQSGIASQTAQALGLVLAARDEERLKEKPTVNLAAYDAFVRAQETCQNVTINETGGLKRCLDLYERAVALDPDFHEAWAAIACNSALLYDKGVSPSAMFERAEQAADRAEKLAPGRPDAYFARATMEQVLRHDLQRSLDICAEGRRRWPTDAALLNQTANLEVCLGRMDDAIEHYRQARTFDPRLNSGLGEALMITGRYPQALEAIEHAMAISPLNLQLIQDKMNILLAQGNLAAARGVLKKAPPEIEAATLVAFIAAEPEEWDMTWVLDREQRDLLLGLSPRAFGGERGQWGLSMAGASALNGDVARTRSFAEASRKGFEEQLESQPDNVRLHAALGLTLAYLGEKPAAVREGELATILMPVSRDAWEGVVLLSNLVRIYIAVGEYEKAIDSLERLQKLPGLWSPGWLRIDPNFEPLRNNPSFQKLIAGAS